MRLTEDAVRAVLAQRATGYTAATLTVAFDDGDTVWHPRYLEVPGPGIARYRWMRDGEIRFEVVGVLTIGEAQALADGDRITAELIDERTYPQ